jgi:transcriptional regulator with XRE-family HTH domain
MSITFERLWQKLAGSKKYRDAFVSANAKRSIPFQLRALMKKMGLSQQKLAEQSKLTQGVISRAVDPNYGNLTINTIVKIANGLDVAYLGVFVPFSELGKWVSTLSEDSVQVETFEQENEKASQTMEAKGLKLTTWVKPMATSGGTNVTSLLKVRTA